MNNNYFEHIYTKHIEKLYGHKRNTQIDLILLDTNNFPHKFSIHHRIDFTKFETYSIDPDNCTDADDAFSIYYEKDKLYLAIHIADPTEFINLESTLWKNIEKNTITKYPSNRQPIHMIPKEIMEMSSLMENNYGNIKKAITILTEINQTNYLPCNNIEILFTKIKVKKENSFSYFQASNYLLTLNILQIGLKISEALQNKRKQKTIGVKLNEIDSSIIKYHNNIPFLYKDSDNEKKMKQMIAEFAIFTNSFIGEYLKIYFNNYGIFRTCNASEIINNQYYKNLNGNELLHEIITNGIQAQYINEVSSHDLVGSSEYTHFTSPIRRVSDCICHYLIKYVYLKRNNDIIKIPFELDKLKDLSIQCINETKKVKKIQYKDDKFRLIQIMNLILQEEPSINLSFYCTSYKIPFLNIIINKLNEHHIYISYTLKINHYINYIHNPNYIYSINICHVNIPNKFDEGTIPELDSMIFNLFL